MTFYVTNQNFVVLTLLVIGLCTGLIYDAFTVKRILLKTPFVLLFFEDVLFCLISCIIFVFAIFITNYGYVRWYEAAAFLSGFALYKLLVSWLIVKVFVTVLRFAAKIIRRVFFIVVLPLKFIFVKLFEFARKLLLILRKAAQNSALKRYSKGRIKEEIRRANRGFEN